jgi:hypothetical protein
MPRSVPESVPYSYQRREGAIPRRSHRFQAMSDLSNFLLIDASTGTVLTAHTCYLVPWDAVEDEDAFQDATDSEISAMAREHGRRLSDVVTLRPILPGESQA